MNNIYHIHKSSNSYWNNEWYDTDFYLCETEEEYQQLMAEYKTKRQKIEDEYNDAKAKGVDFGRLGICGELFNIRWRYNNFRFTPEQKVYAREYYYGHEWQGKTFDAIGFCWFERLERSTHTMYFLKPGSVGTITPCTDPGIGWMYGS